MIDLVSTIPEAVKAIADLVKEAVEWANAYNARRMAAKETNWARMLDASTTVKKLVAQHLEMARIITAPARIKGDLDSTAELLRKFVDDGSLPLAYQEVQGGLEQLIQSGTFKDEATSLMRDLRRRLAMFEYEAFMIQHSSWAMTDAIEGIAELAGLLSGPGPSSEKSLGRTDQLRRHLNDKNAWSDNKNAWGHFRQFSSKPSANDISEAEPATADEMVSVVRAWLKDWFEHVQRTLYGGTGIYHLVGAIEKMG